MSLKFLVHHDKSMIEQAYQSLSLELPLWNPGKIDFKVDKYGIIHSPIGKASFESSQIIDNAKELIAALIKLKPSSSKGSYFKSVTISSTMSPGVKIEPKSVEA